MATLERTVSFEAPGRPGSLVSLKPRYENFIGGKWVPPVRGEYAENAAVWLRIGAPSGAYFRKERIEGVHLLGRGNFGLNCL